MSNGTILFLVEGKNDKSLIQRLSQQLMQHGIALFPSSKIVLYETTIYPLYNEIKDNEDLDIFRLLKEENPDGELKDIEREEVAEIFLFFDNDPHASNASLEKLDLLLSYFDDEFDKGKLYISYPMIESFRHSYKLLKSGKSIENICNVHSYHELKNYKKHVSSVEPEIKHIDCIETIIKVFIESLYHGRHLIDGTFAYPLQKEQVSQRSIFIHQNLLFKAEDDHPFYILCAIPFFLLEYFREDVLKRHLGLVK